MRKFIYSQGNQKDPSSCDTIDTCVETDNIATELYGTRAKLHNFRENITNVASSLIDMLDQHDEQDTGSFCSVYPKHK